MIEQGELAIVIPTYNEKQNIRKLLVVLIELFPKARIFVVDDSSPDGTAEVVSGFAHDHENVRLLLRDKQDGMASAYIDAFARIVPDESIKYIATMDADLSHDPQDLRRLLQEASNNDVVVGSRYVAGGRIKNWAAWRLAISKYGAIYTRIITGLPVKDITTGFAVYQRSVLLRILAKIKPRQPYAFQTEMKYRAYRAGARIKEVPITFRERTSGKSKLKTSAIFEALFFPWRLRLLR